MYVIDTQNALLNTGRLKNIKNLHKSDTSLRENCKAVRNIACGIGCRILFALGKGKGTP
jgi:hypothetical protein